MPEKQFAKGLRVDRREGAPEFVICSLGFNVADFTAFMKENEKASGWVNVDVKVSKGGKMYAELNTWTPEQKAKEVVKEEVDTIDESQIPF